jgi:hypothetical protein
VIERQRVFGLQSARFWLLVGKSAGDRLCFVLSALAGQSGDGGPAEVAQGLG